MNAVNRHIGLRMAYGRKLAGLSQAQMAAQMSEHGIVTSRDQLGSVESGRRSARADELLAYSIICDKPVGWFFSEVDAANLADDASPIPGLAWQPHYHHLSSRFRSCGQRTQFARPSRPLYRPPAASWVTGETSRCRGSTSTCPATG